MTYTIESGKLPFLFRETIEGNSDGAHSGLTFTLSCCPEKGFGAIYSIKEGCLYLFCRDCNTYSAKVVVAVKQ